MKMNAVIAGVGMTRFGKMLDRGLKSIGSEAIRTAISDAGLTNDDIEAAFVGNAAAGLVTGQECIRGQVVLRSAGIGKIPVINVENACASASTAFHQASAMVTAGLYDVVLAVGVEKLYHEDKRKASRRSAAQSMSKRSRRSWPGSRKERRRRRQALPGRAPARIARCSWTSTRPRPGTT